MLHQVGVSFDLYYDARKHKIKIYTIHSAQVSIKLVSVLTAAAVRSMYCGFHVPFLLLSHF